MTADVAGTAPRRPAGLALALPLVAQVLAVLALQGAVVLAGRQPEPGEAFYRPEVAATLVVAYVVLVAVTWRVAGRFGPPRAVLALRRTPVRAAVGLTVLAFVLVVGFSALVLEPLFHGAESQGLEPDPFPGGAVAVAGLVLTGVAFCVLAPVGEELYFRGLILPALEGRGALLAILASSAFFAATHLQLQAFPALFVVGAALGWLRVRTGSVGPPIAFHAANNALAYAGALLA